MPENPIGGGTLLKNTKGEIIPMVYRVPGDSIIIRGSRILHCGLGAQNYNKIVLAPGLGNKDVTVPDTNNDFNEMHWQNSDPIDFMKQWTQFRLNRLEELFGILADDLSDDKKKLLKNMLKENKVMK